MRVEVGFCILWLPLSLYAMDYERAQVQERIKPIGNVRVQEEPVPTPVQIQAPTQTSTLTPGQATYESHCVTCHRDGIAGAPKFRDKADWAPRLAKVKNDLDALTTIALKGLNVMPPKGTCTECSDADIKAAIEYMVPQ